MKISDRLILIISFIAHVQSAKILTLLAFSGKSHNHGMGELTQELAKKGHDITIVTPWGIKNPPKNYRIIDVPLVRDIMMKNFDQKEFVKKSVFEKINMLWYLAMEFCPKMLEIPEVHKLLNEKFDLVIASIFFNDCFLPFAHHNKAPLILYSPAGLMSWTSTNIGNPEPSAYVPSLFLPYSNEMNFFQRVFNTFIKYAGQFMREFILIPTMDAYSKSYYGPDTPPILDIEKNASIVLINNHVSLNYPRPYNPNIIEVGGLHIKQKNQKLPKDLQDFIDSAKDGVIYFSMGTAVKLEDFSMEKIQSFIKTFEKMPQKIIWKWNLDELPNKPKNVLISKWLPQEAILAHPNVKLFITHGGLLSTQEAVYHGMPLVGIPVFGDQELNVKQSENFGFCLGVSLDQVNEETLTNAIKTVLINSSYREKAKLIQKRVRDQPETPLERAVFWTEYVIRHDGAQHLRTSATKLNWFQINLVDVYLFEFFILYIIYRIFKFIICKLCCSSSRTVVPTTKSKKKRQ